MITNLLATVVMTLVTNVTDEHPLTNSYWRPAPFTPRFTAPCEPTTPFDLVLPYGNCPLDGGLGFNTPGQLVEERDASVRVVTTEIRRVETLTFEWAGQQRIENVALLSRSVKTLRLKPTLPAPPPPEEWIEVAALPQLPPLIGTTLLYTNGPLNMSCGVIRTNDLSAWFE